MSHSADALDSFAGRFLGRLPADLAASFSAEQLAAVELAFGMRYRMEHAIDLRRTLRLPWGRFYLVLLAGRDCRAEGGRGRGGALAVLAGVAAIAALLLVA